jgi:hypothetical protein
MTFVNRKETNYGTSVVMGVEVSKFGKKLIAAAHKGITIARGEADPGT